MMNYVQTVIESAFWVGTWFLSQNRNRISPIIYSSMDCNFIVFEVKK